MISAALMLFANTLLFSLRLDRSGSFPRPLSASEERMWLERLAQGDPEARNVLIERNLRLVAHIGAVDKVTFILVLTNKKDAHRRHPACFIIRFRFNAVADKRQWSSAASKPRRKTRAKLCSRFCAENEPSHQTCRSFSASRYSGLERRSRLRCRSAAK